VVLFKQRVCRWSISLGIDGVLETIQRAYRALSALIEDMGVNHGCFNAFMPQECLNCADVSAVLQQMRGKTMAQRVGCDLLVNLGGFRSLANRALNPLWVDVMAAHNATFRVLRRLLGGENPLPFPFLVRIGVFFR